jgi:serine/threonine protein kinase
MAAEMNANLIGQNLGPYRIIEQIGQGGMATVYKAYEPALDRYVAIKVLPQYFAHDTDFSARFDREAKAVARLNHPNILPIYSFGQEGRLSYIAMRYVGQGTLKDRLGQPLDLDTTLDILRQIGQALDYAHRQGIIHRDVKPSNVLMAEGHSQAPGGGDWILLADFGLARMVESSSQLTQSGVGVGTPAYMSPEQAQGAQVDAYGRGAQAHYRSFAHASHSKPGTARRGGAGDPQGHGQEPGGSLPNGATDGRGPGAGPGTGYGRGGSAELAVRKRARGGTRPASRNRTAF